MGLLLDLVLGVIAINILFVLMFVFASWYYKIKAKLRGKKHSEMPDQAVDEATPIVAPAYLTADYYITASDDHTHAIVIGTDETGTVVSETPLGEADSLAEVLALAKAQGWKVADGVDPANDIYIEIVPAPLRVRIVGQTEPYGEAEAIAIAEKANLKDIIGVISQQVDEAEGTLVIEFAVSKPQGWVDTEIQQWQL